MVENKPSKKTIFELILRQFAYLWLFIALFFWANIITIIMLVYCLFKQPNDYSRIKELYAKNFKFVSEII